MNLPLIDRDGWKRLYAPSGGTTPTFDRAVETRLTMALAVVDEDGRRLRPFPAVPLWLRPPAVRRAEERAARQALGVAS